MGVITSGQTARLEMAREYTFACWVLLAPTHANPNPSPNPNPNPNPNPDQVEHAEGIDTAPMVAVAAGRGLWAAVSARG